MVYKVFKDEHMLIFCPISVNPITFFEIYPIYSKFLCSFLIFYGYVQRAGRLRWLGQLLFGLPLRIEELTTRFPRRYTASTGSEEKPKLSELDWVAPLITDPPLGSTKPLQNTHSCRPQTLYHLNL